MQAEMERLDRRFKRFFLLFNLGWMTVSICSLTFSLIGALSEHPEYLYEWRGLAMLVLTCNVPATFAWLQMVGQRHQREDTPWPPPLFIALFFWGNLYITSTLLCLLNNNFVWTYFTALGITYSSFPSKKMVFPVILIFLSYCYFLSYFAWPLIHSDWGALFGTGITFLSLTIVCVTIQYLISERFQRQHLLQQLARTNEELEEAHRRLAQTTMQEQELAVLRERTRLAREMHDTLGHALVLVSVKLEAAQRLRELDPSRCEQELETTQGIVRDSMKELRASIANLRSPALERESACRALSRYAREMAQRCELHVSYDLFPDIEGLPESVEETLWKVGQEALANIEKHAQARNVLLHISRQDGQIFLKIADDGVGLPKDLSTQPQGNTRSPTGHYGLSGMHERVKNAQGQLSIHSNDPQGTTVEVTLPLVETPPLPALPARTPLEITPVLCTGNEAVRKSKKRA